jgi:hypothetical protein
MNRSKWNILCGSILLGAALTLGACAKSGGDNGGGGSGQIAQTPCNSPQGGSCNPGVYSQYPGLQIPAPQAYTTGYSGGYCGCSAGYRPIFNPQWGFACAPANYFTYDSYMGYSYQSLYQGQNMSGLNAQQVYYSPLQYGGQGSCFSDFALSCDVRTPGTCTNGGQCRAIGGGSTIGVCTNGYGVDTYNTGYTGTTNPYYSGNPYYGGYYSNGGNYNSNGCSYRTNSWGLSYYYCSPGFGGYNSGGVAR